MLVTLMYPTTAVDIPMHIDRKKSPRLHVLDTGMLNFFAGVQKEFINARDLNAVYRGVIAEHAVGQELAAVHTGIADKIAFWVGKKQSNAQVDYVIQHDSRIIPIEVKSGKSDDCVRCMNSWAVVRTTSRYGCLARGSGSIP